MDKTTRYREIIRAIVFEYAKGKPIPDIQTEILIDAERDHYKVRNYMLSGIESVCDANNKSKLK